VIFLHYNELREFMVIQRPWTPVHWWPRPGRRGRRRTASGPATGSVPSPVPARLPLPELWGFPDKFNRKAGTIAGQFTGLGGSPGVVEGWLGWFSARTSSMSPRRRYPGLPNDQPGLGRALHQDRRSGDRCGGTVSHPAVPLARVRDSRRGRDVGGNPAVGNGDRIRLNGTTGVVEILEKAAKPRRATCSGSEAKSMRRAPMIHSQCSERSGQGLPTDGDPCGEFPPGSRIIETRWRGTLA